MSPKPGPRHKLDLNADLADQADFSKLNADYALEIVIWICSFSSLRFLGELCVFAWKKAVSRKAAKDAKKEK